MCRITPQERSEYGTSYSLSYYSKDHQHTVLIDTLPMNLYLPSTDNGFMPMFGSEERGWIWAQGLYRQWRDQLFN